MQALSKQFQTMGEPRAIAAIQHSIAHGWQGCFEPAPPKDAKPLQRPGEIPSVHLKLKDVFRDRSIDP